MTEEKRSWFGRYFLDDWRVPFAIVSVFASLALFAAPFFYVKIQNERRDSIGRLCNAVIPTQGVYRLVLVTPPSADVQARLRADPELRKRNEAFRKGLRRGVAAVDDLECPNR